MLLTRKEWRLTMWAYVTRFNATFPTVNEAIDRIQLQIAVEAVTREATALGYFVREFRWSCEEVST